MRDATRVVRAGIPDAIQGDPFLPGPTFAGTYHLAGDPASSPHTYGRPHNPTWTRYEAALADLEGGPTRVFASGMAAVTAVMATVLRPGDVVVMPSDGYYAARSLAGDYFGSLGVTMRVAPTAGEAQAALLAGARLLWIESPSNPGLDVADIQALSTAAHDAGALVAVDNTTATVLGQRPLALGADFSVASDTKALTGHSDLILGHVAVRDAAWDEVIHGWRSKVGSMPGPMEVWLAHRSLATLVLRLERQCANALALAMLLAEHPSVLTVRYPGLASDPTHAVAARQMAYYGPVVSFTLADRTAAERFLSECPMITEATSFGSVHTTAERRARWGGDAVPEGFIRMSVGIEHIDDLRAALSATLDRLRM